MQNAAEKYGLDTSTVSGKIRGYLVNSGLELDVANEVMAAYEAAGMPDYAKYNWNHNVAELASRLVPVIWDEVKPFTLSWLNENLPNHPAQANFKPGLPAAFAPKPV